MIKKILRGMMGLIFLHTSYSYNLRFMHWNTQWLFTTYNSFANCPGSGCVWKNKQEAETHLLYISDIINKINPDILNICEVQGETELNQLNTKN